MSSIRDRLGLSNQNNSITSSNNSSNSIRKNLGLANIDFSKQEQTNIAVPQSTISSGEYSNLSKEQLLTKRKELLNQLNNYEREEKVKWWDEDNNIFENMGNVLYKTFVEDQKTKYKDDTELETLKKQYENISKEIENRTIQEESQNLSTLDKIGYTITGNLSTSLKGIESTAQKILGQTPENTDLTYEERMAQVSREQTSGLGGVALDVLGSASRMLPQMAIGNPTGATAMGFANYGGSAYNEAKRSGADETRATLYGVTVGGLETALNKILPSFNYGGKNIFGKTLSDKLTSKIMNKVLGNGVLKRVIADGAGEFTEEYLQQFLEPIIKEAILEENHGVGIIDAKTIGEIAKNLAIYTKDNFFSTENTYAGMLGFISSVSLGLPSNIMQSHINQNNVNNSIENIQTPNINIPNIQNSQQNNLDTAKYSEIENNLNNMKQDSNFSNNSTLSFSEQVDNVINGTFPQRDMLIVSENTPKVLQDIGLNDLPITMTQKHLNTIMNSSGQYKDANYHDLGIDIVKQLPRAIAEPLNVLKSNTKDDSIVVITDLADNQERPVIASIKIDGKGTVQDVRIDTNVMTSAYGRNNYDQFMQDNIAKGNLLYDIDEGIIKRTNTNLPQQPISSNKKTSDTRDRVQFPMRGNSFSDNNVTTNQTKSQIESLPSQYSMQQNVKNDTLKGDVLSKVSETQETNIAKTLPKAKRDIPQDPTKESTYNSEIVDKKKRIKEKIKKNIQNQSYKAVNIATKTGQKYLDFDARQKRQFKEQLRKYIGKTQKQLTNSKTWNDIKNIVSQYADKEITYVDEELKAVKNIIRNRNIKVTDNLKQQITDYNDFRKENFGKIKLGTTGTNVDSFYQELSEQYPYYFGNATTEVDMLYELSDFMNQDINIIEKFKLDNNTLDKATTKVYNSLMQNAMSEQAINELQKELEIKMNKRTREVIQEELLKDMGISLSDISSGKDISSIDLSRTDPIRVNEKIFGAEIGQKINDATINKTKHNEAERTRWLNKEREEIKSLGIKAQSKESAAIQKYGEKQYITKNNEVVPYGDDELAKEFPDIETQNKIKKAAQIIRNKYDNYIEQINKVLVEMGYNPIKKRPDYMRHFQALNDVFSRFGTPLNAESMQNDSLPTDINGLTDQFKPGKQYFANAMQRMGLKTEYDAITGIDGYLDGASNLIFHTEDIQRYRTLSKFVRDTYGSKNGYEDFANMTAEEQEQRIADIQSNKLAKYAAWLDEQANALAGKKGKIDRGAEELFGRKVYTVLQTAKKQVGSNMTGYNVRSALTNFASAIQGASKTNKMAFLKGTMSTINNIVHNDGLIDKSDFLTNRFGSNSLSPKLWQKMSNAGQIFMKGSDYFTANQVWRSKYFENLSNGMSESEAIRKTDDFASRVMGDRSKGSTATIFNSNTLGFLTQFQLEVNNQWSSLIHDNKMDVQRGNKTGASVVFQLGQLFAMSYLFNNMMKSLTGSGVMIDPIELLKKIFKPDDEEKSLEERTTEVLGEVVNNVPFASIFTGGRIPISEAFEGVSTGFKYATGQTDEYGNKYTLSDVKDDVIESAFYWLLPTGYGQAKKTIKGASMYNGKLPTAGSYTNSGNLRFTADKTPTGIAKALTFGQYASKESQNYIDSGFKTISKNQIEEMKDLGMSSTEYRKYRSSITSAGKTEDDNGYQKYLDNNNNVYWYDKEAKTLYDSDYNESNKAISSLKKSSKSDQIAQYINGLDYSNEIKNKMLNYELNKEDTIYDDYGYVKYKNGSGDIYWYDESNDKLYNKNYREVPSGFLSSLERVSTKISIEDYNKYSSYEEMQYANQNPTKYSIIAITGGYDNYNKYAEDIEEIKNTYKGTKNTSIRKKKIFDYLNKQKGLSKSQKEILYGLLGGYTVKSYKNDIFNYINNQKELTKSEKEEIWKYLYGN